jgi:uncharacterized protein YjbI with pentapeptide repeats
MTVGKTIHMTNTSASPQTNILLITGQTMSRARLEQLLAQEPQTLVFDDCDFEGVDLSRLRLGGFEFRGCSFIETALFATTLSQTRWLGCRGRQADFEAADLTDAHFQNCDLNNSRWRRARLSSTSFVECKLTGANFEEVAHLGLTFEDTLLVGADLRKMSFRKMHLKQLDFSEAELSGCDFRETVFEGGSLRHALLKLTRFDGADLREANLGGLKLVDAKLFRGATLSHRQAAQLLEELGITVA